MQHKIPMRVYTTHRIRVRGMTQLIQNEVWVGASRYAPGERVSAIYCQHGSLFIERKSNRILCAEETYMYI